MHSHLYAYYFSSWQKYIYITNVLRFLHSKQLGQIFWKWLVHKDWPHCMDLCTVLPKLAFFSLWSAPSTLLKHVLHRFFFPGLDGGGRSALILKRSLIACWVYFCKPLECMCQYCSCGRINDIAISQPNSNDFDCCIGLFWLFILDEVDSLTHATSSMYEKASIIHFQDFGLTVLFPHYVVHNICTTFGKIIKLYDCWLAFSINLC